MTSWPTDSNNAAFNPHIDIIWQGDGLAWMNVLHVARTWNMFETIQWQAMQRTNN